VTNSADVGGYFLPSGTKRRGTFEKRFIDKPVGGRQALDRERAPCMCHSQDRLHRSSANKIHTRRSDAQRSLLAHAFGSERRRAAGAASASSVKPRSAEGNSGAITRRRGSSGPSNRPPAPPGEKIRVRRQTATRVKSGSGMIVGARQSRETLQTEARPRARDHI